MNSVTTSKFLDSMHQSHLAVVDHGPADECFRLIFNRGGRHRLVELSSRSHDERLQRACTALHLIRADEVVVQMDIHCSGSSYYVDALLKSASAICPDLRYVCPDEDFSAEMPIPIVQTIVDYFELWSATPLIECGIDLDLIAIAATNAPISSRS